MLRLRCHCSAGGVGGAAGFTQLVGCPSHGPLLVLGGSGQRSLRAAGHRSSTQLDTG